MTRPNLSRDVLVIIFNILPDIRASACVCRWWCSVASEHPDSEMWKKLGESTDVRSHILKYGSAKMIPLIERPIRQYDIILAASGDNMIMVKYMISLRHHKFLDEALDVACSRGNLKMIKYLIKWRANCGNWYDRAIISASEHGHLEAVKLLIVKGMDVCVRNNRALHLAVEKGYSDIVECLISARADIHAESGMALRIASEKGWVDIVHLLINKQAEINQKSSSALLLACKGGHADVVEMLICVQADVNAKNNYAIEIAAEKGFLDIVKLLLAAPYNNSLVERGSLALVKAITYNQRNIIDYLTNGLLQTPIPIVEQRATVSQQRGDVAAKFAGSAKNI
jgi:hypothetical protein